MRNILKGASLVRSSGRDSHSDKKQGQSQLTRTLEIDRRSLLFQSLIGFSCGTLLIPIANGQQPPRVHRIGLALGGDDVGGDAAFRETLRELGWIEGQNLLIKTSSLPGPDSAADLARMDLELVVIVALLGVLPARAANPSMPLVIVTTPGIVSNGLAQSIEHPGGNVTGIDELPPRVTAKRLELLKAAAPAVSKIALLSTTPGRGGHETQLTDAQEAATRLGVEVKPYRAATPAELESALASIAADGMNGLLNFQGGLSVSRRKLIIDFAAKHRIPAIYQAMVISRDGGLMSWAPDLAEQHREAARYVDKILRGAHPGDLPIRYPDRYFLSLNNTAARNIGLTFPPALVAQADRVLP
jgi:putative tryptophan/tyrosine transport system substrate-binding protein